MEKTKKTCGGNSPKAKQSLLNLFWIQKSFNQAEGEARPKPGLGQCVPGA
jgi:hypothetical protein